MRWFEGAAREVVVRHLDSPAGEAVYALPNGGEVGPLAWSPDGARLLVSTADAGVERVDLDTELRVPESAQFWPFAPVVPDISGPPSFVSGTELVVAHVAGRAWNPPLAVDLVDGTIEPIDTLPVARLVAVNPADGRLLLLTPTGDLLVSDADGQLQLLGSDLSFATWAARP